jgi:ferrous iron transport protein B
VLDLPGTYSLRARSPDEVVTRDAVLGRLSGEQAPDVLICVADATNLRLVLRLVLELKQVGRPFVLALNMYDIAQRQGLRIDLERLSAEIGAPIVTTVATRKRGLEELVAKADALSVSHAKLLEEGRARERLARADRRRDPRRPPRGPAHRQGLRPPARAPRHRHRQGRRGAAASGGGLLILIAVMFVMFQAVFTWASRRGGPDRSRFRGPGGRFVAAHLPEGCWAASSPTA